MFRFAPEKVPMDRVPFHSAGLNSGRPSFSYSERFDGCLWYQALETNFVPLRLDPEGRFTSWHPGVLKLFGIVPTSSRRQNIGLLLSESETSRRAD